VASTTKIAKSTASVTYASILPVRGASSSKASGETRTYRVRAGDTLWGIARKYGTTIVEIKKANGMRQSIIQPGQTLTIPGDTRGQAAN
jgi:LysM repeat protein